MEDNKQIVKELRSIKNLLRTLVWFIVIIPLIILGLGLFFWFLADPMYF